MGAGGSDVFFFVGDALAISSAFAPANYVPAAADGFSADTIHGHLEGIDVMLGAGAGPWDETASVNKPGDTIIHPDTIATDSVAIGVTDVSGAAEDFRVLGSSRMATPAAFTTGDVLFIGVDGVMTTTAAFNGLEVDLNTNVTLGQGQIINLADFTTPGATQTNPGAQNIRVLNVNAAAAITSNQGFATVNWTGLNFINLPTITATLAGDAVNSRGIQINQPALGGGAGNETSYGIYIVTTSASANNAHIVLEGGGERAILYRDPNELVIDSGVGGTMNIKEAGLVHIALVNQTQFWRRVIHVDGVNTIFDWTAASSTFIHDGQNLTTGTLHSLSFGAATIQTGNIIGMDINIGDSVTKGAFDQLGLIVRSNDPQGTSTDAHIVLEETGSNETAFIYRNANALAVDCGAGASVSLDKTGTELAAFTNSGFVGRINGSNITTGTLFQVAYNTAMVQTGNIIGLDVNVGDSATKGAFDQLGLMVRSNAPQGTATDAQIVLEETISSAMSWIYRDNTEMVIESGNPGRIRFLDTINTESIFFINNAGTTQLRLTEFGSKDVAAFCHNNDAHTGIYWPAAGDILGLTAGGSPCIMSDSSVTIAAASNTAGAGVWWTTEDGGASTGIGRNGALYNLSTGDGSAGAAGNNNGGDGGLLAIAGGDAGNATGTGTGGFGSTLTISGGNGGDSAGATGTAGGGGNIDLIPGDAGAANGGTPSLDGSVQIDGGKKLISRSATEIGISVGNDLTLTVGTSGSLRIPYLDQAAGVYTDGIGGNVDGCIGINDDNTGGPTYTIEVRADGGWRSVAVAGYVIQRQLPYTDNNPDYWVHPKQIWNGVENGVHKQFVDESKCVVCGEQMAKGDQVTMWGNYERSRDLHCVFGHMHLELNDEFQALEARVRALEAENERLRCMVA